jgi:ABC-type transport system substrate-binding protein
MPGHSDEIGLPYDPNQALSSLAEAGYRPREDPAFPTVGSLIFDGGDAYTENLGAQWWDNLKVKTTWEFAAIPEYFDRLDQLQPHLYLIGWLADYPDPDNFLRVSRHPLRWTGWRNETYDTLVKAAGRVKDQETRLRLYQQAEQILVEEAAVVPLTYGRLHMLVKPWVSHFPVSPLKWWFFKDVVIEPH